MNGLSEESLLFRGDEDDAIGATGTIYGSRSILEDFHRSDIMRIKITYVIHNTAIDHKQRVGGQIDR